MATEIVERVRSAVHSERPVKTLRSAGTAHYVGLLIILAITVLWAISVGRFELPYIKVLAALGMPFTSGIELSPVEQSVVSNIRLPRVITAGLVGAMLAMSGAVLQGVFRNPLVGPQILGVSGGAAFGGVLAILVEATVILMMVSSFVFGVLALAMTLAVEFFSKQKGTLTLVLGGIVVGALFGALVSIVKFAADPDDKLPAIVFWLMGSFVGSSYEYLTPLLPLTAVCFVLLYKARYVLNVLALGDEDAKLLKLDVGRARILFLIASTALTSATVAVAGIVGWVGLMIPHICRFAFGADYRQLLVTSSLFGAIYMIVVDTIARNTAYGEIPVGVITALLGAPIFGYLLCRKQP